jgi:DNA-binding SARP family transcriptional activator/tetratricopeptide (TPR) repeat protein
MGDDRPGRTTFGILGPLEVWFDGTSVPVGSARQQTVLAVLLLGSGRVVPIDRLVTALWDDEPPATARVQAQICISRLRARLRELMAADVILTQAPGYRLEVPEDAIDLARFRGLVARGREAVRRQDLTAGASALREAVALWRGSALAGLDSRLIRAAAVRLDEERLTVTEEHLDLVLALGGHREVIGELRDLVAAYPLRERLYGQLMRALYRDGQRAAALEVFRNAHRTLRDELGLEPGAELRTLERAILDQELVVGAAAAEQPTKLAPRQLPAAPQVFVGRDDAVARLRSLLVADGSPEAAVVVVTGPPGVGKTALALYTAYELAERFPDGQLFAYLRGGDARPVAPGGVLGRFLRSLGVEPEVIPASDDERAAVYRGRMAGRRVLVFLDDATVAWQVQPLVPGAGGVVLVTSRSALPGLPAHRVDLQVLTPEMSRRLLAQVVGEARLAAEPDETAAVMEACGHLPLALQVAGAKLATRPHWRLAQLAERLSDESRRLDELSLERAGVRASIAVSFEAMTPEAQRLLALLRLLGPTDFAAWVASPLLEVAVDAAADVLDELVDGRLVEVYAGTGHRTRYRLHDLVRAFARELLATQIPAAERRLAQRRLLQCWLFLAREAHRREYGGEFTVLRAGADGWPLPEEPVAELLAEPFQWFNVERANLTAAVSRAAELDDADLCVDLAISSVALFENRSLRDEWRETHDLAFASARRAGNSRAEAAIRCSRAGLSLVEQRWDDAVADLEVALTWLDQAGDWHGRGLARRGLAFADRMQGHYGRAAERYELALADLRSVGDRAGEAGVLTNLGQLRADQGNFADGEGLLRQALAISIDIGERRGEAQARYRLGELLLAQGALAAAGEELDTAHALVTAVGDLVGTGYTLLGLGNLALAAGHPDRATARLAESLSLARRTGSRVIEARALLALADQAVRAGDLATARNRLDQADALFAGLGSGIWRAQVEELRRRLAG